MWTKRQATKAEKRVLKIMQKEDKSSKLQAAVNEVFSNPNLPLYLFFNNFNFLVGSEYLNED